MRWMSWLERTGKELCGEKREGVVHGKNLGFCVKVPSGGSLHAASGKAGWCGPCWEPDGSIVEDYGSDDGFVGGDYGFFLLAPVGASRSF